MIIDLSEIKKAMEYIIKEIENIDMDTVTSENENTMNRIHMMADNINCDLKSEGIKANGTNT